MVRIAFAVLLALVLAPAGVWADEDDGGERPEGPETPASRPDDSVMPFFLGEVVVSENPDEEPPPGTTDSLDGETLVAAGVTTVGEGLDLLPGVSMSTGGRNEQKAWVRGYEQSNVLLLVDGIPVADPYYGDLDLGQLPIFDVTRISVTRGAASPLYGPNGLGGVINVVTAQGGEVPGVTARLRLSNNNTILGHASTGGRSGRINWYLGAGIEESDGWSLSDAFEPTVFEDGGRRVNSDVERASLLARVGWEPDEQSTLYASVRFVDAEKGIPFHTTEPAGFVAFARFPEWRQTTVGLGYERRYSGGAQLRGQLYGLAFDNTLDVYTDPGLEDLRLQSEFSDRVHGGYAIAQWPLGKGHLLGASVHLRRDNHTATERHPDGTTDPNERYEAWTSSLAIEDRWQIDGRSSLVGSLAAERLEVDEALTLRPGDGSDELVADPLSGDTLLSPQLELRTELGRRWSATGALYHRGRFPTMRQLYGTEPPNPALRPQRTTGIDLGVSWLGNGLNFRGNLFFDQVSDLISRQDRFEPYENQDEAEIRGIELRFDGVLHWFEYRLSWTHLDPRFTRSSEGMEEIPYVPNDQIEVFGVAHLGRHVDLRGTWLFTGDRVYYDFGEKAALDAYHLFNLGVMGRLSHAELSIHIDNLLDADVEQEEGFPLPGRRLWAGVRFWFDL